MTRERVIKPERNINTLVLLETTTAAKKYAKEIFDNETKIRFLITEVKLAARKFKMHQEKHAEYLREVMRLGTRAQRLTECMNEITRLRKHAGKLSLK